MTPELINAIASIGTLLVISATAVAAVVQLRHMRGGNQIVALTECREVLESEAFTRAQRFIARELADLMNDPQVRAELLEVTNLPVSERLRGISIVGNFFESMGSFVKHDIIDEDIAMDLWGAIIDASWKHLAPALAVMRRTAGSALWENFEYLASLSAEWISRHPRGTFPAKRSRLALDDPWRETDEATGIYSRQ